MVRFFFKSRSSFQSTNNLRTFSWKIHSSNDFRSSAVRPCRICPWPRRCWKSRQWFEKILHMWSASSLDASHPTNKWSPPEPYIDLLAVHRIHFSCFTSKKRSPIMYSYLCINTSTTGRLKWNHFASISCHITLWFTFQISGTGWCAMESTFCYFAKGRKVWFQNGFFSVYAAFLLRFQAFTLSSIEQVASWFHFAPIGDKDESFGMR